MAAMGWVSWVEERKSGSQGVANNGRSAFLSLAGWRLASTDSPQPVKHHQAIGYASLPPSRKMIGPLATLSTQWPNMRAKRQALKSSLVSSYLGVSKLCLPGHHIIISIIITTMVRIGIIAVRSLAAAGQSPTFWHHSADKECIHGIVVLGECCVSLPLVPHAATPPLLPIPA